MSVHKNQAFAARLKFALRGLAYAVRTERSLRLQLLALVLVVAALVVLRPGPLWWALVLITSSAVIAAELFNTAVERLADELHPQDSAGIGLVKDCAAAAVLVASLGAIAVAAALIVHLLTRGGVPV
ncbi:MAG: diacylglycerol kinase [Steroidobacterales bacterium]|jgi:diacylglycerol kinase